MIPLPRIGALLAVVLTIGLPDAEQARAGSEPSGPILALTKEQWREDLKFFAHELPKRHANAFCHTPREQFEAAVADLDRRLDRLNGDEMYVALDRIANLIGDGHTYVQFPPDTANLPLNIKRFGDEYRIDFVAAGWEKALGARVSKVQDVPIARAAELLLSMTPQAETLILAQARVENFLTMGIVLHGYGIIADRNSARYTLADDNGHEFTVDLQALPPDAKVKWVAPYKQPPLFRQKPLENFWYTYLPDARTVYCNFRGYRDLKKNAAGLFKLVDERHPDKLVIDMRQNGGGDYTVGLRYLVHPIRDLSSINRKGRLFILVGPNTFSAAMSNATHFRSKTSALLVGQTIGERPNSYQESRHVTLPNSHLTVNYSVRFYKFVESGENIIRPDREIIPSWHEFKTARDPVLEWVRKYAGNS
jgi:hypothetical protein